MQDDELGDAIDDAYPRCPTCREDLELGDIAPGLLYLECTRCGTLVAVTPPD